MRHGERGLFLQHYHTVIAAIITPNGMRKAIFCAKLLKRLRLIVADLKKEKSPRAQQPAPPFQNGAVKIQAVRAAAKRRRRLVLHEYRA